MSYKKTALWQVAFEQSRIDATEVEQESLASCYNAMRKRASALVARIAVDLPHMTIHDVTHLDALWEMASLVLGENPNLNPAEAFVFGSAILFHDAAMTIAAFPGGLAELHQQTEWRDLYANYTASMPPGDALANKGAEERATADALRLLHAKHAEKLPKLSWPDSHGQPMFIIENQQIRNFYGKTIGKIAYSHWWSIDKVEEECSGFLGALPGVTNCTVDIMKVACLLRIADAMHIDQRRAPPFNFALVQPTGISAHHWKFQERMAKPFIRSDALVYTAQPPFEADDADVWWTAFDALQTVDRELRDVDRLLRDSNKMPLIARRVEGAHSPSDLARTIETIGWTPVESRVRVSDVPKIVATLGGSKLYGEDHTAPLRELIQNGLDAITARRRLQGRQPKWGELQIKLQKLEDGYWLSFEDNGVGMSQAVMTGPLIDFGNSLWRSSLAMQEFPGLASAGMKPRGKYGIGFFSVFMLAEQVRVISRRYDRDMQAAKVLEFRHGLASRPNVRNADPKDTPIDGGTRVEIKLNKNPIDRGGILIKKMRFTNDEKISLSSLIFSIAPTCDTKISVTELDGTVHCIDAGDWIEINSTNLINRIKRQYDKNNIPSGPIKPWEEIAELRDDEGRIFGRARINLGDRWESSGMLTIDGLAANNISHVAGVLLGVETTASRGIANPIVPAQVLASWSSEQAIRYAAADVPDEKKALVAAIVMACGGDASELPFIRWRQKWMTGPQFASAIESFDRLLIHEGMITHDGDDPVGERDFESNFEVDHNVVQVIDSIRSAFSDSDWIKLYLTLGGTTPIDEVYEIINKKWGHDDSNMEFSIVGRVHSAEIERYTSIIERHKISSDDN